MGIGMRELLIILVIALVLFGAKKLRNVGSDLGSAVRGFKKAVSDGDDEQSKQIKDLTDKDAEFGAESTDAAAAKPTQTDNQTRV